jgi:hypothetical protein
VAAAVLVWSILPDLTPRGVRRLLVQAARPIPVAKDDGPPPLLLKFEDAVALAREELVRHTLRGGPCSFQALAAITGLDLRVVDRTIDGLLNQSPPVVRRLSRGRLERFELIET